LGKFSGKRFEKFRENFPVKNLKCLWIYKRGVVNFEHALMGHWRSQEGEFLKL
jgi:hypothetical protein